MRRNPVFIKITQWEHWPSLVYYLPLLPLFIWRSLKAGHPIYYTVANPSILFSGNGTESKFKTLGLLPEKQVPRSLLFLKHDSTTTLKERLDAKALNFPLIAKPDIGFRGYLVKKIDSMSRLQNYLKHVKEDIIIQEFIPYESELGIFYHRMPGQKKGKVTSVTIKKFMRIKGDGLHNVKDLIQNDNRAFLYAELFHHIHQDKLDQVLGKGEELILSFIGNHSKGTQFINGNHLINDALESCMDDICQQIKGWYYGRLDIKFKSYDQFLKRKDFKIIEVNGIISEPTHIYDASNENASYFQALKSINLHWRIMGGIAQKVHRDQQVPYPSVRAYFKNMIWLRFYIRKLKKLNEEDF